MSAPQNARRHGLSAQELCVPPDECEQFEALLAKFQNEVRPQGAIQEELFDELVSSAWNLRRIRHMEANLLAGPGPELDRLARHKTRIERTFHRSLRELKALQTDAAIALTLPKVYIKLAPLASTLQIAKRTQTLAKSGDHAFQKELDDIMNAPLPHRRAHQEAGDFSTSAGTTPSS